MKEAIRLTNKTAIALRKSAQRVRTAYFAAAVILSVLLGALGVFLGFLWLPAVPLMIGAIALLDSALMLASRSRFLALLGQAICTEAAARELRADKRERMRREQAAGDLQRVKEDLRRIEEKQIDSGARRDAESGAKETETPDDAPQAHHRRRKNSLELIRSGQAR